jgi:hypothetical protein
MARTVQECNTFIVTNLVSTFANVGITITPALWSNTNLLRLICYTIAIAQSLAEQVYDVYLSDMQTIQSKSSAASKRWLQDRAFRFQYSSTNPQYVAYNGGVIDYPVINTSLQIIKACAIQTTVSNVVNVKVAKGSPLGPLSALELTAAQDYYNTIGAAGITYTLISLNPDKIYIKGNIYYKGVYSAVIQANVINVLNSYLEGLSKERFGGDILLSDIKSVIRNIEGITDISIERISCRTHSQTLFAGIDLVLGFDELIRKYSMDSGYLIQETTASNTFADTLTFIPE